jgi:5-methylcytosine-specific restriction endonuclease McrA
MNKARKRKIIAHWCAGQGLPCFWCSREFGVGHDQPNIDHFIPISRLGPDDPNNTVVAHVLCNSSRGSRFPTEQEMRRFVRVRGRSGIGMLAHYAGQLEASR